MMFSEVSISRPPSNANEGDKMNIICKNANVQITKTNNKCEISCSNQDSSNLLTLNLLASQPFDISREAANGLFLSHSSLEENTNYFHSYYFHFLNANDRQKAFALLNELRLSESQKDTDVCLFDKRTDESSSSQYFQFYGYLSQQQNMMQDFIRTSTYQKAILDNFTDFSDKVVLDVGAGSGILSFFAIQAGASCVYAIEASDIAVHADKLVKENGFSDRIKVLCGKVEELELPEKVDVIISEPMGYMLFNERMLETYLHAKKWLKPGGKMYPSQGILFIAPFTDEALYMEQISKCNFWSQTSFYAVDLSSLRPEAIKEYFRQPIVDNFDVRVCLTKPIKHVVDFLSAKEDDLHEIHIPLEFTLPTTAIVHGLAFWFDVLFDGSQVPIWLSTSPTQPLTHWYQVRCLMPVPLLTGHGQTIRGFVHLKSNTKQSYEIDIELRVDDNVRRNSLDLKNPYFRYTMAPMPPPGNIKENPTDQYYASDQNGGNAFNAAAAAGQYDFNSSQNFYPSDNQQQQHQQIPQYTYYGNATNANQTTPSNEMFQQQQQQQQSNNCTVNNDGSGFYYSSCVNDYRNSHQNENYLSFQNQIPVPQSPDEPTSKTASSIKYLNMDPNLLMSDEDNTSQQQQHESNNKRSNKVTTTTTTYQSNNVSR